MTGYVIEKRLTTAQQWTKIKTLDANCLSYCVDNIKEKSEIEFRVFAENVIGLSPPATSETVTLKSHASKIDVSLLRYLFDVELPGLGP